VAWKIFVAVSATAPAGAVYALFYAGLANLTGASGDWWFGDFEVVRLRLGAEFTSDSGANLALAALAVASAKIANLAVDGTKLAALAVDAGKLAASSVTSTKIGNLAVGSAAIAALAVGTGHIQDLAVSGAKIANATITSAKIISLDVAKLNVEGTVSVSGENAGMTIQYGPTSTFSWSSPASMGSQGLAATGGTHTCAVEIATGPSLTPRSHAAGSKSGHVAVFWDDQPLVLIDSDDPGVYVWNNATSTLQKVVSSRQTGPGNASGWADSVAQTWANNLLTSIRNFGALT
jgi:hypothetical protein